MPQNGTSLTLVSAGICGYHDPRSTDRA